MAAGLPYDSDAGRDYAACVTAIMCGEAYLQSLEDRRALPAARVRHAARLQHASKSPAAPAPAATSTASRSST